MGIDWDRLLELDSESVVNLTASSNHHRDEYSVLPYMVDAINAIERLWKTISEESEPQKALPGIEKVIFHDPATIVFWEDGTKTVVKCGERDVFDPEKGLAMAISKKALGNQGNYYNVFRKELKGYGQYKCIVPFDGSGLLRALEYAIINGFTDDRKVVGMMEEFSEREESV